MQKKKHGPQSLETKARITNAVVQLVRTHSIDNISVQDICTHAKVGVGTFYHYYASKDEALFSVYHELDDYILSLPPTEQDAYASIMQFCSAYARFANSHEIDFMRAVYGMLPNTFTDQSRPIYTALHHMLKQKQTEGVLDISFDVDAFCAYILVLLRGITYDWCVHKGSYDIVNRVEEYMEKCLIGYQETLKKTAL